MLHALGQVIGDEEHGDAEERCQGRVLDVAIVVELGQGGVAGADGVFAIERELAGGGDGEERSAEDQEADDERDDGGGRSAGAESRMRIRGSDQFEPDAQPERVGGQRAHRPTRRAYPRPFGPAHTPVSPGIAGPCTLTQRYG